MATWTKTHKNTWRATLADGTVLTVERFKKTKGHTVHNPQFPCYGRKPRFYTSVTFCWVYVRRGDVVTELETSPDIRTAKAAAELYATTGQGKVKKPWPSIS